MRVIDRIVSRIGRRVDDSSPMVDARLPDGSRVNAIIPPLAVDGPLLSIRRFPAERLKANDLVSLGALTAPMLEFLSHCVRSKLNCLISGGTGAGKTTLLELIPRLIDPTAGAVMIEGTSARDLELDRLWSKVGVVPQRAYLFSGTVASNLRYGNPDATDAELWAALEVAQGKDFVEAMPQQLEAPIAQGGTNVSGGQRQRLSIARALVRKPSIYVFDDSFSALDLTTDAQLRAALKPYTADAAVVIVAQRVSTIATADDILVLEDGRLVGRGTHADLLEGCSTYAEIVQSQIGERSPA
jgi:ATP-binding cassette subfamily B protein